MLAAYAARIDADDPLSALEVGERRDPQAPSGWTTVAVKAAGLNHHDVWSLRGVGLPADRLPMVLGCDGAGVDPDGNEVIVHAVVASDGWTGDETLDPRRTLLSELHDGTLAQQVIVPAGNVVPKPGGTVLVQGAGGGVATALVQLGSAAGYRMWVTSRDEAKGERALSIGADRAFESGARLPDKVDAVMETVGAATWTHSINCLRPGGSVVICGATSGDAPPKAELTKIYFRQLRVLGSTMGNRSELERLARFVADRGTEPVVDSVHALADAREGFARIVDGEVFGKVVITVN